MNRIIAGLCAIAAAVLLACGGPSAAEKKAEKGRRAEAQTRLAGWETNLAAADGKSEAAVECLRAILGIQAMELDQNEAVIDLFEANRELLEGDVMANVYLAVAQSKMAGASKKIEDKLSWLRKGMGTFETLREEYPDDEYVFLYQASTYASFPAEVGAKADVLDILGQIRERYGSGSWALASGTAGQLIWVFNALRENYPDKESAAEIGEVESAFRTAFPVYEAAYLQNAAEAKDE